MTLDASLACCTEGPARLAGLEHELGRIAPGFLADLVVWNVDLLGIAPERLAEARPVATVLGGEVVFREADTTAGTGTAGRGDVPGAAGRAC